MLPETAQWQATVGATDTIILGVNQGRTAISISPPTAGRVSIAFGRPAILDQGITIQAGTQGIILRLADVGANLREEIHAIADAAGRNIGGVDAFLARS